MISSARRTLTRFLPGVLGALLAGAVFEPAEARGGCDLPMPVWGANDSSPHHPAQPFQSVESFPTHQKSPAPCHGPTCSRRPIVPAPMNLPTTPPPVAEFWAVLESRLPSLTLARGILLDPNDSSVPVRRAGRIFHPPRSTSVSFSV